MVHKEVVVNEGTGNLRWSVYLNEDGRDLSGMTFTDKLLYTVNNEVRHQYNLANLTNLTVYAYTRNDTGDLVNPKDVTKFFRDLIPSRVDEYGTLTIQFQGPATGPKVLTPTRPITSSTKHLLQKE